jgi:hypothetical protein
VKGPVEVLADLLQDVGSDIWEADLTVARLGEAAWDGGGGIQLLLLDCRW